MNKEVVAWKNRGQAIDVNGHQIFYIKEGNGANLLILHRYPTDELINQFCNILNYKDGKSIAYLIARLVFEKLNHQERWIRAMQNTKVPMFFINGPLKYLMTTLLIEKGFLKLECLKYNTPNNLSCV
ncbi:hypothetical protein [Kordia sp.]|uniref:hypothetical protein n=1 Tax=Kordia sp. TaxID=1965332 RepID=UPI003D29983B